MPRTWGRNHPLALKTNGLSLACVLGLALPGLDKTEKREELLPLTGAMLELETLEQTHRQVLKEVYEKNGL